jgi:hypothetical protein
MTTVLTARMPVVEVDGTLVVMLVGTPDAAEGDTVTLVTRIPPREYPSLIVAGVDTAPVGVLEAEVVNLFGFSDTTTLVEGLSRYNGTGYSSAVPVTIYTLRDAAVEEEPLAKATTRKAGKE